MMQIPLGKKMTNFKCKPVSYTHLEWTEKLGAVPLFLFSGKIYRKDGKK